MFNTRSLITCFFFFLSIIPVALCQRFINTVDTTSYALYDTHTQPWGIVLANLNNDDFPDMAIISRAENLVSIQYNDRTGRFGPATTYAVGEYPQSIAAADLNKDGRSDLVISSQSGTTSVLLNSVNGLTGVSGIYTSTQGDSYLAVADVNGDTWPDIVNGGGWGEYRILTNNGNGSFTSGQAVSMPEGVKAIAAADFDGDSRNDLAIASGSYSNVRILRNIGNNTFSQLGLYTVPTSQLSVKADDVNSDGRIDLIVNVWSEKKEIGILLNTGNGQLGTYNPVGTVDLAFNFAFQDVSGDGIPDLLTPNAESTFISVWLGHGDGTFGPVARYQTGSGPGWLAVADLNGDGQPDLAGINWGNSTATVLMNRGLGRYGTASITPGEAQVSILADIDNDGYADLIGLKQDTTGAVTAFYDQALLVYHNRHDGTFDLPHYQSLGCQPNALARGDLNNDGWVDLVSTNYNGNTITVLLNNRQGLFSSPVKYSTGQGATEPRSSELVDLNNDGFLDIITQNNGSSSTAIVIFINRGDGSFKTPVQYSQNYDSIDDFTVGDFNGDDRPDIAVLIFAGNPNTSTLRIYMNKGDGSFTVRNDQLLPKAAGTLISYDVNNDGKLDLLLGSYVDSSTDFMQNDGSGVFTNRQLVIPNENGPMYKEDVNGDGLIDLCLLLSNFSQDNAKRVIAVRLNNGIGGFTTSFQLSLGFFESFSADDVNGDGRPDILTGATNGMYIWYNQTPTTSWGMVSAQPGPWNETQTWIGNRIPIATDHVLIRHPVQLPAGYTGRATRVGFDQNGLLQYNANTQLRLQKRP